ncbi:glycine betaine ABC transporter substrate-binding protein, partial [Oceanidesulfovibrio marinus]
MSVYAKKILAVVLALTLSLVFFCGSDMAEKKEIRCVYVGWNGVTIKTELAKTILDCLGYETDSNLVSVTIPYKPRALTESDLFLGNWMPSMKSVADPFFKDGSVVQYVANMPGAKYTLAVPASE